MLSEPGLLKLPMDLGERERERAMTVIRLGEALNLLAAEIRCHLNVNCFKVGI